jgi:RNA polymerase sigma factor for flagellar operon FliA
MYSSASKKYNRSAGGNKGYKMDPKEREAMIVKYADLVKQIAGRMAVRLPSSVVFDELLSAGCLGLINAIDRFDPSRDVNIKTYAEYRIKGAILDELRRMDWYSRSMRKKVQDIEKAITHVEARESRPAEDKEIASALKMTLEEYYDTLAYIHRVSLVSLDEFIKDEVNSNSSKKSFQDSIRSTDDPEENIAKIELKQVMADAIKKLSEKEQMVISLYYYNELTLKEIGHVLGLTESRICQIHAASVVKLRSRMKSYYNS